ncbi:MAG: hypothetical protein ACRESF_01950, partial [Pseudomonas sp.]
PAPGQPGGFFPAPGNNHEDVEELRRQGQALGEALRRLATEAPLREGAQAAPPAIHVTLPPAAPMSFNFSLTEQAQNVLREAASAINVPAPNITVQPAAVTVNVPPAEVTVNVQPTPVTVNVLAPEVIVEAPQPQRVRTTIERDQDGNITGSIQEEE